MSWSRISYLVNLETDQKLTCTVLKPIQADNETTERIVSNTCREPGGEISAIDDCVLSCFNPVSVTATMSRFFDEGDCFRFDRSCIDCCHLIMSFEPEGPGFKLTFPASRPRYCN